MRLPDKFSIRKDVDGLTELPKFEIGPGDSSFAEDRYHRCGLFEMCLESFAYIEFEGVSVLEVQKLLAIHILG